MAELTQEQWAKRRRKDFEHHVKKCEANSLPAVDWETFKHSFDGRNTAEENHQRVEELLFKRNLRNMKGKHNENL
jgi:hypothetical protein